MTYHKRGTLFCGKRTYTVSTSCYRLPHRNHKETTRAPAREYPLISPKSSPRRGAP